MISFCAISDIFRALSALWVLILILVNIGSAAIAAIRKRFMFMAAALLLFCLCFFLWQVMFDLSLFFGTDKVSRISLITGGLPWVCWVAALVALSAASVLLLCLNIRYDKAFITTGAIKNYLDKVPCGICCWRESGRVLFSNICMNRLCGEITGSRLLNGNQFRDAVRDGILNVNGKMWRFACRVTEMDGETLYEMIASDITAEYAKTEALERDKAELDRLNRELSEYYLSIDESVRRQEILQAKMNIHDEMNRLMLSTVAADKNDTGALDNIFSLWEQNALLLCMEAEKKTDRFRTEPIDSLAEALGVRVIWRDSLPDWLPDKQKELLSFTAQEAIVNSVKHAEAKKVEIAFETADSRLICRITNDGALPSGKVSFEGGLANIKMLAEKQGASVRVEAGDAFTLILSLPRD